MPRSCRSKQALLRGIHPSPHQKIQCGVCTSRCIFCDIWKLATLVTTHVPLSSRYSTTPSRLQRQSSNQCYDYERSEQMIEAQFNTQRARLASIMSICTVDGAEQSDGLRMAHDRCLGTVKDLLYQEAVLEEALIRPAVDRSYVRRESNCGSHYYNQGRRPSLVTAWSYNYFLPFDLSDFSDWAILRPTKLFPMWAKVFLGISFLMYKHEQERYWKAWAWTWRLLGHIQHEALKANLSIQWSELKLMTIPSSQLL